MDENAQKKPPAPDLPKHLRKPLENQSPEQLEAVVAYAGNLAEWKRQQSQERLERRRAEKEVDEGELKKLSERNISTNLEGYQDVPTSGAYISIKTTKKTSKKSYRYYYWQWREGDSWKNEYIAPVVPQE